MDGEWLQAKILLTSIWIWKDHGTKELELKASFTACVACTMYSLIFMPIVSHHDLPKCFCSLCLLENHTIIWIISVGGDPYRSITPTPCTKLGHLQLSQFAQVSIQPDLGCFHGWVIHQLSGHHHSYPKKLFPSRLPNLSFFLISSRYRLSQLYWSLWSYLGLHIISQSLYCFTKIFV